MNRLSQILVCSLVGTVVSSLLAMANADAGELSASEFRELHRQLRSSPSEPWRTIPWKISLLEAQRTAAREKKPLFIWAMDGHPLGCT